MKAPNKIEPLTQEEGKAKLAGAPLSTWKVK